MIDANDLRFDRHARTGPHPRSKGEVGALLKAREKRAGLLVDGRLAAFVENEALPGTVKGAAQPSGYTEPILHEARARAKRGGDR